MIFRTEFLHVARSGQVGGKEPLSAERNGDGSQNVPFRDRSGEGIAHVGNGDVRHNGTGPERLVCFIQYPRMLTGKIRVQLQNTVLRVVVPIVFCLNGKITADRWEIDLGGIQCLIAVEYLSEDRLRVLKAFMDPLTLGSAFRQAEKHHDQRNVILFSGGDKAFAALNGGSRLAADRVFVVFAFFWLDQIVGVFKIKAFFPDFVGGNGIIRRGNDLAERFVLHGVRSQKGHIARGRIVVGFENAARSHEIGVLHAKLNSLIVHHGRELFHASCDMARQSDGGVVSGRKHQTV